MEYKGDYGFDALLTKGGAKSAKDIENHMYDFLSGGFYKPKTTPVQQDFGCSSISVKQDNEYLFGRNFDWYATCKTIIVHTKPKNGYESYSTACIDFLGFGPDFLPESFLNKMISLAAIYVPLDGINEKGLVIADLMAGDNEVTNQTAKEKDLTTTTAIRLILDKAATVEEAIALLQEYNMHSDIGSAHHLAISDINGNSVVVEYIDSQMYVTKTDVVTNHYLTQNPSKFIDDEQSKDRYNKLKNISSPFTQESIKNALENVSQKNYKDSNSQTKWSIVYSRTKEQNKFYFYWDSDFTKPLEFSINK